MSAPLVSIGLPVRNGENFLAAALESILAQTADDLEVIISDNASSDGTADICRRYVASDRRVRYVRNERDLGAAPNFNRTWRLARGAYFKWAAHDDLLHPRFLESCLRVLERSPDVVLCHTRVEVVDAAGRHLEDRPYRLATGHPRPGRRFAELLLVPNDCYEVFGVIRADVLARTRGIGGYPVGDRVLLAELALRGRFHQVDEPLFTSREHPQRSVRSLPSQHQRAPWFDARYRGRIAFPEWRTFLEYGKAVHRAPVGPLDRLWCQAVLVRYLRRYRHRMCRDLALAAARLRRRRRDGAAEDGGAAAGHALPDAEAVSEAVENRPLRAGTGAEPRV